MFTGLVESRGTVASLVDEPPARRLEIDVGGEWACEAATGDSVALNGCCLTVVATGDSTLAFLAGSETLERTNLGELAEGDPVNLERPLAADGRLGGHFVQGHIDGIGRIEEMVREGEWVTLWVKVPDGLARYLVEKGSVAVDGISLTVVSVEESRFQVAVIPHTLDVTTLGTKHEGETVNIETDILAKYVEKLAGGAS